jgi:dTDP-4-amino-4,6-dideoxygalactose transaminase
MHHALEQPEQKLLDMILRECEVEHAMLVGRANAGLACALRSLCPPGSAIVFPAILCPSPVFTAQHCGFTPIFCDVDPQTYTMNPEALAAILQHRPDVRAVLVAHLYGHGADMERIGDLCREHKVLLINDAAQAFAGRDHRGKPLAAAGDIALLSFGHTKLVDGGGGALLVHREELLAPLREAVAALPQKPANAASAGRAYRTLYYAIDEASKDHPNVVGLYEHLGQRFSTLYEYRFPGSELAQTLLDALEGLEETINVRKQCATYLQTKLQHPLIQHPKANLASIVPWRYTIRVAMRDHIADKLREAGFDASPWYPNLQPWFASGRSQEQQCEVAEELQHEFLNLWIDGSNDVIELVDCLLNTCERLDAPLALAT